MRPPSTPTSQSFMITVWLLLMFVPNEPSKLVSTYSTQAACLAATESAPKPILAYCVQASTAMR